MVELEAGTVQLPLVHAVGVVQRVAFGGQDSEVLNVSPGQVFAAMEALDEAGVGVFIWCKR